MSRRRISTGMAGAALVAALFLAVLTIPSSGADFTAQREGSLAITITVPAAQPPQPFDWNWTYPAPTCAGVTIAFPSNLPADQQGVMEVNVVGGSVSGMQYKLEGTAYWAAYPNGHAGKTVFIPWTDFRNNRIPTTGTWTVRELQVHGTNYHSRDAITCDAPLRPKGTTE